MTEIRSHEFDAFLQKPLRDNRLWLIYGPDRGLVSERAQQIAAKTGVPPDDPFSWIRLDSGSLQQNPTRLMEEAGTIGLFGGEKLIWVRATGTEKALIDGFSVLAQGPAQTTWVIIEAGDLKKGAGLRKIGETAKSVTTVSCYGDDARAINTLIDQELAESGTRMSVAAREKLTEALGGDRLASRSEIRKLFLYCRGRPVIEEEHVVAIIGDASAISVEDAVDAVLKGDVDGLQRSMSKISASKIAMFLVLQACLRQFQLLEVMRSEMDNTRGQPQTIMASLGRNLHFRRKPLVESALRRWTLPALRRELTRLQAAIFQSRARQSLEDSIAMQTLLAITLQSARP